MRDKGRKFEDKVSKCIGSGNLWFNPGDLSTPDSLYECKFTEQKGFRVTTKILEKLWGEALNSCKSPVLVIGIKRNEKEIFILNCKLEIKRK